MVPVVEIRILGVGLFPCTCECCYLCGVQYFDGWLVRIAVTMSAPASPWSGAYFHRLADVMFAAMRVLPSPNEKEERGLTMNPPH